MSMVVDVPLNTAIADLDDALRALLRRELERHGFEGVDIAFDAPSKDWSSRLTNPTVDLFLYDIREASDRAALNAVEHRGNGGARVAPPALELELTYAVTAWTKAVQDEHRLLSQVLAVLFSYHRLPDEVLAPRSEAASRLGEVEASVGRPREEKADFWTSVGGQYKASIDYAVHLRVESGVSFVRGPEVRTQSVRTGWRDRPGAGMVEMQRMGGSVADADGRPVADAWVALPEAGRWASTDAQGRFVLDRIPAGEHAIVARTADGAAVETRVTVPGRADLVVKRKRRKG